MELLILNTVYIKDYMVTSIKAKSLDGKTSTISKTTACECIFKPQQMWESAKSRTHLNTRRDDKLFELSVTQESVHILIDGGEDVQIKLFPCLVKIFDHF